MPTIREQIITALLALLETIPAATVKREAPLPETVPAGGLIILRDGDPGDPEVLLSPPAFLWQHQAEVDVIVGGVAAQTASALDDLLAAIGQALAADRTLGGLADWLEWGAPKTRDLAIDGAAGLRGAVVTATIHYASADPLG
jgi:hypothetical protein